MDRSIIQPQQENSPAKIAAMVCCVIAVGLLAASLLTSAPAGAGGKALPHTALLSR